MFRTFFAFLIACFFPALAAAQICGTANLVDTFSVDENARLEALVDGHAFATGLMWVATRPDSRVVVVGTLHIPDPRFDPMVDLLAPEITGSDVLILEATRAVEAEMASMAATRPEIFFLTEGPTLIDLLSEAELDD